MAEEHSTVPDSASESWTVLRECVAQLFRGGPAGLPPRVCFGFNVIFAPCPDNRLRLRGADYDNHTKCWEHLQHVVPVGMPLNSLCEFITLSDEFREALLKSIDVWIESAKPDTFSSVEVAHTLKKILWGARVAEVVVRKLDEWKSTAGIELRSRWGSLEEENVTRVGLPAIMCHFVRYHGIIQCGVELWLRSLLRAWDWEKCDGGGKHRVVHNACMELDLEHWHQKEFIMREPVFQDTYCDTSVPS